MERAAREGEKEGLVAGEGGEEGLDAATPRRRARASGGGARRDDRRSPPRHPCSGRTGFRARARLWSRRPPASASAPAPRRPPAEGAGEGGAAWPRAGERNRRERGGKREI